MPDQPQPNPNRARDHLANQRILYIKRCGTCRPDDHGILAVDGKGRCHNAKRRAVEKSRLMFSQKGGLAGVEEAGALSNNRKIPIRVILRLQM